MATLSRSDLSDIDEALRLLREISIECGIVLNVVDNGLFLERKDNTRLIEIYCDTDSDDYDYVAVIHD